MAMLVTRTPEGTLRSRPMALQDAEFDGSFWFFSKDNDGKAEEITADPQVNISFSKPDDQEYVSISGRAELIKDPAKMKELWKPVYKAWFPDGLKDPHITLLHVQAEKAEYWDPPSSPVVYAYRLAKQAVTGHTDPPQPKEHAKMTV
jgi:general stress protein 26